MIRLNREIDPAHLADLLCTESEPNLLVEPAPVVRDLTRPRLVLLTGGAERAA